MGGDGKQRLGASTCGGVGGSGSGGLGGWVGCDDNGPCLRRRRTSEHLHTYTYTLSQQTINEEVYTQKKNREPTAWTDRSSWPPRPRKDEKPRLQQQARAEQTTHLGAVKRKLRGGAPLVLLLLRRRWRGHSRSCSAPSPRHGVLGADAHRHRGGGVAAAVLAAAIGAGPRGSVSGAPVGVRTLAGGGHAPRAPRGRLLPLVLPLSLLLPVLMGNRSGRHRSRRGTPASGATPEVHRVANRAPFRGSRIVAETGSGIGHRRRLIPPGARHAGAAAAVVAAAFLGRGRRRLAAAESVLLVVLVQWHHLAAATLEVAGVRRLEAQPLAALEVLG